MSARKSAKTTSQTKVIAANHENALIFPGNKALWFSLTHVRALTTMLAERANSFSWWKETFVPASAQPKVGDLRPMCDVLPFVVGNIASEH